MTRKHFPHYWPFMRGCRWFETPLHWAQSTSLWSAMVHVSRDIFGVFEKCGLISKNIRKWKQWKKRITKFCPNIWQPILLTDSFTFHQSPVNSPHKGQWRGALMFSLICTWINGWVKNREAGDLRRHRAHYDVIVMWRWPVSNCSNRVWYLCKSWISYITISDPRIHYLGDV